MLCFPCLNSLGLSDIYYHHAQTEACKTCISDTVLNENIYSLKPDIHVQTVHCPNKTCYSVNTPNIVLHCNHIHVSTLFMNCPLNETAEWAICVGQTSLSDCKIMKKPLPPPLLKHYSHPSGLLDVYPWILVCRMKYKRKETEGSQRMDSKNIDV